MRSRGLGRTVGVVMIVAAAAWPATGSARGLDPAQQLGQTLWTATEIEADGAGGNRPAIEADGMRTFMLHEQALSAALAAAPASTGSLADGAVVSLPAPDGGYERFRLTETRVMAPKLARLHPEILTYGGEGVDDPTATVRLTDSPLGLQASVRSGKQGAWFIDPLYRRDTSLYASYFARDLTNRHGPLIEDELLGEMRAAAAGPAKRLASGSQLRTYRLALVTDPGYADYFGASNVSAAKVALVNRIDQIYEDELTISLELIGDNDLLNLNTAAAMTGADGPCGTAPCYSSSQATGCSGSTLSRTRIVIGQLIGASDYDIGHIALGLPGGGVAELASVGRSGKARGCTGLEEPVGDFFAVDYVAHEMGHQFAGNHTFNGTQGNCSGFNRNPDTSVEPGSGSSIMAYAGICAADDLQPHSDPYFSQRSFEEIETYVSGDEAAIEEVQNVSLRNFGGSDSFKLRYEGATSATITNGVNYNTAGIEAELTAILPPGAVTIVEGFGGSFAPSADGFQVSFDGALAGTNVSQLQVVDFAGATGFVGETDKGGPVDNKGTVTATGNTPPVVSAPTSYTIPYRTPFALTGSASDANPADVLVYMWEQNDPGGAAGTALSTPAKVDGPLFRQFGTPLDSTIYDPTAYNSPGENHPTTDPARVFPDLQQILDDNTNAETGDCPAPATAVDCYSEFLPTDTYPGPMHFRFTARDSRAGGGGVNSDDTTVNLAPGTGPFLVTAPSTAVTWTPGATETVTWAVAGTSGGPIAAANVKITLSTDGGETFPTTLLASTPNDGSAPVTVPAMPTSAARVKVEAVDNVFFDISDTDFTIAGGPPPQRTLTVTKTGAGAGTVSSSPAGIDCGADCSESYAQGSEVVLSASPGTGSSFGSWSGCDAPSGTTCTVTVGPGDESVTVSFADSTGPPGKLPNSIDFAPLGDHSFGDPGFDVTATAASGDPVTFTSGGSCTVAGSRVSLTSAGQCTISAHEDGNDSYEAAPDVSRTFEVAAASTRVELKSKRKVKRKKKLKVRARVVAEGAVPTGSVEFSFGKKSKTVALADDGSAATKLKARKRRGKVRLTATYVDSGPNFAEGSGASKLVKVKKR